MIATVRIVSKEATERAERVAKADELLDELGGQMAIIPNGVDVDIAATKAMTVQTLIFDRATFDHDEAIQWIEEHDFTHEKPLDESDQSLRVRQRDPGDFVEGSMRTIDIRPGVKAVVGRLATTATASEVEKRRERRSASYLEAVLDTARAHLPGWLWQQVHGASLSSAGGRARWRLETPSHLERAGLGTMSPQALRSADDGDVMQLWSRLQGWYASAKRRGESVDPFVAAAAPVLAELRHRSKNVGAGELVELATKGAEVIKSLAVSYVAPLLCAIEDKRLVYAIAMEPDVVDAHGEVTSREEIEKAAHGFMLGPRAVNVEHQGPNVQAEIVECFVAPSDMTIGGQKVRAGSWVVVIHVSDDALWMRAKAGEFGGVSIEGLAERTPG